ncbi:hypothetical protein KSP40_PGU021294 [Platanthera guangdongensis]|uniref:Secreted protein n=1 Tax=Platanthera guangdongensis TaxID=2320717 RepID=A0ABR2LRP6_9ASPA
MFSNFFLLLLCLLGRRERQREKGEKIGAIMWWFDCKLLSFISIQMEKAHLCFFSLFPCFWTSSFLPFFLISFTFCHHHGAASSNPNSAGRGGGDGQRLTAIAGSSGGSRNLKMGAATLQAAATVRSQGGANSE